ncbi:MAG: HEAT repeat domain-containing protein [Candidatus Helarchaeota archaeon]
MQISTDFKELIEDKKFKELVKSLISHYKDASSEQERKNASLELLKISINFPTEITPVLIKKMEEYKASLKIKEQEGETKGEISPELEENIELTDNIYNEILRTLCQVAAKDPEKSVSILPILIRELSSRNSYETCEKTIEAIQSANPTGCVDVLAKELNSKINKQSRWRFALQLGKIGTAHPELVDKILTILSSTLKNDQDEKVRAAATEAMSLIRIENVDEEAVKHVSIEEIEKKSKDESELVQDIAKERLIEIKQISETEKLIKEAKNEVKSTEKKEKKSKKKEHATKKKKTNKKKKNTSVKKKK